MGGSDIESSDWAGGGSGTDSSGSGSVILVAIQ